MKAYYDFLLSIRDLKFLNRKTDKVSHIRKSPISQMINNDKRIHSKWKGVVNSKHYEWAS